MNACRALSMFWISEIRTKVNNNVAIGGKACYWFIPHNGRHHGAAMVRPLESFKNNRASSCDSGLQVESAVEERDPEADRTTPFLGRIGYRQVASLDGPDGKPTVNAGCYPVIFEGWNVHHTKSHGMWIRQGSVKVKNSQFSDCPRCFTYPTGDCPGQTQTLENSLMVGYTENVGDPANFDQYIINDGKEIAPTTTVETMGGIDMWVRFFKAADGVWRSSSMPEYYPNRGINLYDTFVPSFYFNNVFYDWPAETSDNRASAIGMHLHNRFGMTADESKFWNNTFHNTARRAYFGDPNAEDGSTPWNLEFGDNNFGKLILADGEKNSILYDTDGTITGQQNSLIIAKASGF